jgi:tetrahydromethanopterin S-methyltransferase subunit C
MDGLGGTTAAAVGWVQAGLGLPTPPALDVCALDAVAAAKVGFVHSTILGLRICVLHDRVLVMVVWACFVVPCVLL